MTTTPYALVSSAGPVHRATKRELVRLSRELEHAALAGSPTAVAAALQDVRFLTERTRAVYASLAAGGAAARLHARGLQSWVAPGVTGIELDDDDPLVDEWVVVVPGPRPVALAATDLHDRGEDADRGFVVGVSRDPHVVAGCGRLLGI
jgi:hypothetical protein